MNLSLPFRRARLLPLMGLALLAVSACASTRPEALAAKPGPEPEPACPPPETYLPTSRPIAIPTAGCVNLANLAAMVADPNDLTSGKPLGATDGARQALIVDAYRRNQDKPAASTTGAGASSAMRPSGGQ